MFSDSFCTVLMLVNNMVRLIEKREVEGMNRRSFVVMMILFRLVLMMNQLVHRYFLLLVLRVSIKVKDLVLVRGVK